MATDVNLGMLTLEELRQLLGQGQGTDRYSQIMGQMGGGSPYSQIMAQTPAFQNPYANAQTGAMGGYNPNMYGNAAAARMTGRPIFGGAGGTVSGGGGYDAMQAGMPSRDQYSLTNGLMASLLGMSAVPNAAIPVSNMGTYANMPGINDFGFATQAEADAIAEAGNVAAGLAAAADAEAAAQGGGGGEGIGGGDISGASSDTPALANGGPVDKVGGPNPPGPDDGIGMLQLGEYVIKKSAVDKYGTGLLDMINNGKIPAKKMKSLLG